ncbi:MAG: tetratricopeptide repeat protein, partial [Calditrichaeota bacterium]
MTYTKLRLISITLLIYFSSVDLFSQDVSLGKRYFFSGDYEKAIKELRTNRPTVESLLWLSLTLSANGRSGEALDIFTNVPDWQRFVPLLNRVAEIEYDLGHYDKAKTLFQKALQQKSRFIPAQYNYGKMQYEWGNPAEEKKN